MIYRNFEKVKENIFHLCASGIGLAKSEAIACNRNYSGINMSVWQLSIPNYYKTMYNTSNDMTYHICGYGQSNEEALTRVLGESVERFSFMSSYWLIKDTLVCDSYENLIKKEKVLPLDYINVLSDYSKPFETLNKEDNINWLRLKNFCNNEYIYYPLALISTDVTSKKNYFPTMSTGTATHITYENALLNAMIEQLQIHLFMASWYGVKKMPIVDIKNIKSNVLKSIFSKTFKDNDIEITVLDCGLEKIGFYNYISIVKSKNNKYPAYAVGVQGGFDPESVLLRSIMEACSIFINLQGFYIYQEQIINKLNSKNVIEQYNLDAPFLFWSNFNNLDEKEKIIENLIDSKKVVELPVSTNLTTKEQLDSLLSLYQKNLHYFSVLDISSEDSYKCGYRTVRVIAPEMIPMNCPAAVYAKHPYFLKNGGIRNGNFTHPLP